MIHEEVSGKIIGAAMEVLNELKPGLDEKLYERALIIELKRRGHVVSVQRSFPVSYSGELIGNLIPDLIVDNMVGRRSQGRRMFHRNACGSDDRVLKHYGIESRASDQFQKCALGMETRIAYAETEEPCHLISMPESSYP